MLGTRYRLTLPLLAALGLVGCSAYGGFGGISLGYGDGYYDPYYDGYGYYGWYDDFYYPGVGYYVYDRGGGRHRWSDKNRRYWEGRRGNRQVAENWSAFRADRRDDRQAYRAERRGDREAFRQGTVTREQFRTDRREDRREFRQEWRDDNKDLRRDNRADRRGYGVAPSNRAQASRAERPARQEARAERRAERAAARTERRGGSPNERPD
jgi:hypothetical protein